MGVNGTPAVFINGRKISGAYPFETFKKIADEELAKKSGQASPTGRLTQDGSGPVRPPAAWLAPPGGVRGPPRNSR